MSKRPLIWGIMPYYEMNEVFHVATRSMMETCDNGLADRGKWKDYPQNSQIDYCYEYLTEMEHRNHLIKQVPDGDYFITWDSDLVFFGAYEKAFNKIKSRLDPTVWFNMYDEKGYMNKRAMMFRKTPNMEYAINHFSLFEYGNVKPKRIKFDKKSDHEYNLNFLELANLKTHEEKRAKLYYKLHRPDKMNFVEAYAKGG